MAQKKLIPSTVVIQRFDQLETILTLLREDIRRMDHHSNEELEALKKKPISYSIYTTNWPSELPT